MRTLAEIDAIIQKSPPSFRRWCYAGACACAGCLVHSGITREEFFMWKGWRDENQMGNIIHGMHLESKGMMSDDVYLAKIKKGDGMTIQYRDEIHHCQVEEIRSSGHIVLHDFRTTTAPVNP